MINYTLLAAELAAGHPITGAYDADDALAAEQGNLANVEVNKLTTPQEAADATDANEFNALPDADQNLWVGILSWDSINLNEGIGLATATGIWAGAAGTITRPALIATRTHLVGRFEELGFGRVRTADITQARSI
jgi:hypothetical protein